MPIARTLRRPATASVFLTILVLGPLLGTACGSEPQASVTDNGTSGTQTDSTAPTTDTTTTTNPGSTTTATSNTESGSEAGTPQAECWQHLSENACLAAGCAGMVDTFVVTDLASCELEPWDRVCVGSREASPTEPHTTFFRMLDGSQVFHPLAACEEQEPGLVPEDAWTECTGEADDPPECACFCAGGRCPGHWQIADMLACNLPDPCGTLNPNQEGSQEQVDAAHCVLQALQAGTAAHLHVHAVYGDPVIEDHVFVRGNGTADHSRSHDDVSCFGCCPDFSPTFDNCTLKPASFFADCEAQLDLDPNITCAYDPPEWFQACTPATPTCP